MPERHNYYEPQLVLRATYMNRNVAIRLFNNYVAHGKRVKMLYTEQTGYKIYTIK